MAYFNEPVETMRRAELNALIEERIQYTVRYAEENSPFYSQWFREHGIDVGSVRTHEDLAKLPIISGQTIRESQPPITEIFGSGAWAGPTCSPSTRPAAPAARRSRSF